MCIRDSRIDDQYEIIYKTKDEQTRSLMLTRIEGTNWASMPLGLLKELLPHVTCVQFLYGAGLQHAGESLTVHVDLNCNHAHVSSGMLVIPPVPCDEVEILLKWGPYHRIRSCSYVDLRLSDPIKGVANHVERFFVVNEKEYPEFDIHRVTVGQHFVEKYLRSKRASYENGDMLWMDNAKYIWKSTYQQKTGRR